MLQARSGLDPVGWNVSIRQSGPLPPYGSCSDIPFKPDARGTAESRSRRTGIGHIFFSLEILLGSLAFGLLILIVGLAYTTELSLLWAMADSLVFWGLGAAGSGGLGWGERGHPDSGAEGK